MEKNDILEKLGKKEIKAEDMAKTVIEDPSLLPEIFNGISSGNPRIKLSLRKY